MTGHRDWRATSARWKWRIALAVGVGVLAWQGAQVLTAGMVGVPGVAVVQIASFEDPRAHKEARYWVGGITTVAKTHRTLPTETGRASRPAPVPALSQPLADAPWVREPASVASDGAGAAPSPAQQARTRVAGLPPQGQSADAAPSVRHELAGWVKSRSRAVRDAVDAAGNPLRRFDVWLEAPEEMSQRIASVTYEYDGPSGERLSHTSRNRDRRFRARFRAAACAPAIAVTVTLDDETELAAEVDGCALVDDSG